MVMIVTKTQRPRKSEREKTEMTIASFNEEPSVQLGVSED